MAEKKKTEEQKEFFTKEMIVNSKRFASHSDLLGAVLKDGNRYTIEQVEKEIDFYKKRSVK